MKIEKIIQNLIYGETLLGISDHECSKKRPVIERKLRDDIVKENKNACRYSSQQQNFTRKSMVIAL